MLDTERHHSYAMFRRLMASAEADGRLEDKADLEQLYKLYSNTYHAIQVCERILEAARPLILSHMTMQDQRQKLEGTPAKNAT